MGNRRGRESFDGWLSPWTRNVMLVAGWGVVAFSLLVIRWGFQLNDGRVIAAGLAIGFIGWLLAALMPDPVPAPRKPLRRRAAMLARVGGHLLPR